MSKKSDFVAAAQELSTVLAKAAPQFQWLFETYFDRGYNVGGVNPLLAVDVPAELQITAADIGAFITLAENVGKFLSNQAAFQSDYGATLNKLRVDI